MSNSISIEQGCTELGVSVEELRSLLNGYYKNPENIKFISLTKWERIKEKYGENIVVVEDKSEELENTDQSFETTGSKNVFFTQLPTQSSTHFENIEESPPEQELNDKYDNYRQQANLQRKTDMEEAWTTTAEQATEFAQSLEEGFWLMTAAARSSRQVQDSERVRKARDLAMGIGDGGLQASAHIESVEKYLESQGFFQAFLTESELPRQLTD